MSGFEIRKINKPTIIPEKRKTASIFQKNLDEEENVSKIKKPIFSNMVMTSQKSQMKVLNNTFAL